MAKTTKKQKDSFEVKGQDLLQKIKDLIHQGNIKRITILDKSGQTILVIPLTIGVIGVLLAPYLAIIGGLAAFITECTIKVERK